MKAAIIGGGVIGGGWAARFLLNGWDVCVADPDPEAARKITAVLYNARRSLPALYDKALPPEGKLSFASVTAACANADWIQESVPERLEIKHAVLDALQVSAAGHAIIASSTSGFKPSQLNTTGTRVIVAHPFNPVYLLPLVELVGEAEICSNAAEILRDVGFFPLHLRQEIDAHIADRLLEAVWREALWLVSDGIATTQEIDEAIRMGFGLRWAQMGLFETYRIAGGEAGMKHFLAQFGPALEWPWTKLMEVPEFTPELVDRIAQQSDAQSGHKSIRDLERLRDDTLVGLLRSLKKGDVAAGSVIAKHEANLTQPENKRVDLPITVVRVIPQTWTDYNGHMNETHYLELGAQATDQFMELIGADAAYIAQGMSYFTVENHLRYLAEVKAGQTVQVTTQILAASPKKMHLFHHMCDAQGALVGTMETLLLHVSLETRQSTPAKGDVYDALFAYANAHASFPKPKAAGRFVGQT